MTVGEQRLTRRARIAQEVLQTSAMDCGPAALKCLLAGFGVPASYDRLREACQTEVDGTSIDTIEEVARQLGLDAEQVIPFSAVTGQGRDELAEAVTSLVQQPPWRVLAADVADAGGPAGPPAPDDDADGDE